jgi:hypothetical protein
MWVAAIICWRSSNSSHGRCVASSKALGLRRWVNLGLTSFYLRVQNKRRGMIINFLAMWIVAIICWRSSNSSHGRCVASSQALGLPRWVNLGLTSFYFRVWNKRRGIFIHFWVFFQGLIFVEGPAIHLMEGAWLAVRPSAFGDGWI